MLKSPVLFLVFNRPDVTRRVFEAIRQARPPRLYVAADGPRQGRDGEADKVAKVREIATAVDWPCEVKTLFRNKNLGCKVAVSSAIDWFFDNEEAGIILEDDCLPHHSFFPYCEELLERYRDDDRVALISGNNFQNGFKRNDDSYYFSRYNHIWGWSSWRDRWQDSYDLKMSAWPTFGNKKKLLDIVGSKSEARYWEKAFDSVYREKIDTWDYQWTFACWLKGRVSILPNVNLVSNIGFGPDATHTNGGSVVANLPTEEMCLPLKHPASFDPDSVLDFKTYKKLFCPSFPARVIDKVLRILKYSKLKELLLG